jgi:hypothetical protein
MTQTEAILSHLKKHGSITSLDAIKKYGCTRLSGRIYDLKKEGVKISGYLVNVKNRFGNFCTVKKYYLAK